MGVPLALRHPVAWTVFAVSGGALVGWVCSSVTRRALAGRDLTAPLVGSVLLGAGVGYATDVSPFIVCALAGLVTVNASPRRRELRTTLRAWDRPMDAGAAVLTTMVLGVALAQLAAPPLMRLAVRAGPAPLTPAPARPELTANAPVD